MKYEQFKMTVASVLKNVPDTNTCMTLADMYQTHQIHVQFSNPKTCVFEPYSLSKSQTFLVSGPCSLSKIHKDHVLSIIKL